MKIKLLSFLLLISFKCFSYGIDVKVASYGNNYKTKINAPITTEAKHYAEIFNDNDWVEEFRYVFSYCEKDSTNCSQIVDNNIRVKPHSSFVIVYDSILKSSFKEKGTYQILASSAVYGKINKSYTALSIVEVN